MKYSGGTFSGVKTYLASAEITVLGHRCTIDRRLPDQSCVEKIINWGPCRDLSDVRVFLGTIGVCQLFIWNFTHLAYHLVKLTRKGAEWEFGQKQLDTMNDLKDALLKSPALRPINYKSEAPVILSVDTSYIAIGYLLSQCDLENPRLRYYAKFGLITLNDRESRFSQPKLELYGLYWTLRALKPLLIGIRNLVVEVDVKYNKGMLKNLDVAPSASMNWWILSILLFHFTLVHVPGTHHGPDGLLRRRPQPGVEKEVVDDDFEDWVNRVNGFVHMLNPSPSYWFQTCSILAAPLVTCYITESTRDHTLPPAEVTEDLPLSYEDIPCSEKAITADLKIRHVRH